MLSGHDYRSYASFNEDVAKVVSEPSQVDLELSAEIQDSSLHLSAIIDASRSKTGDIGVYFAVIENNLSSDVDDGENEGKRLHHDYVVRKLFGPVDHDDANRQQKTAITVALDKSWKLHDLQVVAFAENQRTWSESTTINPATIYKTFALLRR